MQMTAPLAQASTEDKNIMINIVKMELAQQQSRKARAAVAAAEEARQKEKRLNEMFARDLEARRVQAAKRPGLLQRMGERIVNAYAVAFAAFVLWGEALGLWIIEED